MQPVSTALLAQHALRLPVLEVLMRCATVVRERQAIVLAALASGLLLGAAYYFVAPRTYRAQATLLVTREHAGVSPAAGHAQLDHRLATYVELFKSAAVLDSALRRVQEMPPAARIDFAAAQRDKWNEILASQLTVAQAGDAELITVVCQSRSAEAAPLLVEAAVGALAEYVQRRHKEHSLELLAALQQERLSLEQRLLQKQKSLADAQARVSNDAGNLALPLLHDRASDVRLAEIDVQRLSAAHDALAARILDVEVRQHRAPVRFDIVSPALADSHPAWPQLPLVMLTSGVAGLGLGLAIVWVLHVRDDRFRSPDELQASTGAAIWAMVEELPVCEGSGLSALQMHAAPHAAASEAFRTLRAALAGGAQRTVRLTITSTCAGDGKTTIVANLGVACAQAKLRTLLIDADLRRGGLSKLLQCRGQTGVADVLAANEEVSAAAARAVRPTGARGLEMIACGRLSSSVELLGSERMAQLLAWASQEYDQVLIDTPPLLAASDAIVVGRLGDGVLLVTQPTTNRRREVLRAVRQFRDLGAVLIGMATNRVSCERGADFGVARQYAYHYRDALEANDVPDDEAPFSSAAMPIGRPQSASRDELRPRRVA